MSEDQLRQQLYDSFKNRAMLYFLIFDELRQEIGQERAAEIMKRAIYKRGFQKGAKYAGFAPNDLQGLCDRFVGGIPDDGAMFSPEVKRCDADGLDIDFHRCPLKDAWKEAGLSDADCETICEIAAAVDTGMFEGAGFDFTAETWKPGQDDCCHLHIRPKK
jgi:hypothetical protein